MHTSQTMNIRQTVEQVDRDIAQDMNEDNINICEDDSGACVESTVTCSLKYLVKHIKGRGGVEQRLEEPEAQLADLTNY